MRYDKKGEEHYNTISAFIKSMRASQPDAALYYFARMIGHKPDGNWRGDKDLKKEYLGIVHGAMFLCIDSGGDKRTIVADQVILEKINVQRET